MLTKLLVLLFITFALSLPGNCNRGKFVKGDLLSLGANGEKQCEDMISCHLTCADFVQGCTKDDFFNLEPLINQGFEELQAYRLTCSRRLFTVSQEPKIVFDFYNTQMQTYTAIAAPKFEEILNSDSKHWTTAYTNFYKEQRTVLGEVKYQVAETLAQWIYAVRTFQKLCSQKVNWSRRETILPKFEAFEQDYIAKAARMKDFEAFSDPGLVGYKRLLDWETEIKTATGARATELRTIVEDYKRLKNVITEYVFTQIQAEKLTNHCKCSDFSRFITQIQKQTFADIEKTYGINQQSVGTKFPMYYQRMTAYCQNICQ